MTAKCTSIDYDNNLRPGADKEGEGGLRGSHVVPPPPPVPPSPLEPSAVQRVGSPSGEPSLLPGKASLPTDVNPLPGCSDPDFCVGGLDHLHFKAPGGLDPTRDQIVWVTRR